MTTILPSSGADPQDFYYLNYSMPGSYSRRMYQERICSPLWPVLGCKTAPMVIGDQFVPDMTAMPAGNPFEPSDFTKNTNPFYWDGETIYSQYFAGEEVKSEFNDPKLERNVERFQGQSAERKAEQRAEQREAPNLKTVFHTGIIGAIAGAIGGAILGPHIDTNDIGTARMNWAFYGASIIGVGGIVGPLLLN